MRRIDLLRRKTIYYQGYHFTKECKLNKFVAEKLIKSARENDEVAFMNTLLHRLWEYKNDELIDEINIYTGKEKLLSMRLFTIGVLNALID